MPKLLKKNIFPDILTKIEVDFFNRDILNHHQRFHGKNYVFDYIVHKKIRMLIFNLGILHRLEKKTRF